MGDILFRVRTNRESWQLIFANFRIVQNNSRVQGQDLRVRRQQRVNINPFDPSLLGYQQAETDEQSFEISQIYRNSAANALEHRIDTCLLRHSERVSAV